MVSLLKTANERRVKRAFYNRHEIDLQCVLGRAHNSSSEASAATKSASAERAATAATLRMQAKPTG